MKLKSVLGFLRDVGIAAGIIAVILVVLFLYTDNWPPMVVIESDSMQHGHDSSVGVIDTGDLVLVKKVSTEKNVITYIEGQARGYRTYGDYGDVIIYRKNGGTDTPVIHRSVMYLKLNETTNNSFDIPDLSKLEYGEDEDWYVTISQNTVVAQARWYDLEKNHQIHINDYGYAGVHLKIDLGIINKNFGDDDLHGGFITVGDHNAARNTGSCVDQEHLALDPPANQKVRPVKAEWIVGKARGELPWFGIVKLKVSGNPNEFPTTSVYMVFVTLGVIIALPIVLDFLYLTIKKKIKGNANMENEKDKEDEDSGEETGNGEGGKTREEGKVKKGKDPPADGNDPEISEDE